MVARGGCEVSKRPLLRVYCAWEEFARGAEVPPEDWEIKPREVHMMRSAIREKGDVKT
jgi:hypothetical protein